jgi:hypothetical protein
MGSSLPRPLSELAPTEKRRNSPSFNQVTKVCILRHAPFGELNANSDSRRWLSMWTRLHSSRLLSTLLRAIRHHDSSGKAVIQQHQIDSTRRMLCLAEETPRPPPLGDPRLKSSSARRVSRTAICSLVNKSKNMIQHQCL